MKAPTGFAADIHDDHGDDHGGDHHLEVLGHADRGDDRIEREHQVDRDKLNDDPGEGPSAGARLDLAFAGFDLAVNFMRRLGDQKHAAADQDDVAPGYLDAENAKERAGEAHQPGEPGQHDHAEDEGEREADQAGAASLVLGEPRR